MPKVLPLKPDDVLCRWANLTRSFYGHPIWLVGSQLYKDNPRDVDIVCWIPDDEFCFRYGVNPEHLHQWNLNVVQGVFEPSHWAWSDDNHKKGLHGMRYTGLPIDFKVMSQSFADMYHLGCTKIQLDTRPADDLLHP